METLSSRQLEKQLERVESLMQHKETLIESEYYDKYSPIFELARIFLSRQKVLLYGGTAINALMPKKYRFYGERELPDFDVFCVQAKTVGDAAVAYFKHHGYIAATLNEALHRHSYKIIVDGLTVIDITTVSRAYFKLLAEDRRPTVFNIDTVNPQFLRMTLHTLLSQPKDAFRWKKTLQRIISFYKVFPPTLPCKMPSPTVLSDEVLALRQKTRSWIKSNGYVVFSMDAWLPLLPPRNEKVKMLAGLESPVDILVEGDGSRAFFNKIVDHWKKHVVDPNSAHSITVSKLYHHPIYPNHVYLMYHHVPFLGIYQTPACVSFIQVDDAYRIVSTEKSAAHPDRLKIATIQTVLRLYLQLVLARVEHVSLDALQCKVAILTLLSLDALLKPKLNFLKSFVLTCYGVQPGVITLKRERYLRLQKRS